MGRRAARRRASSVRHQRLREEEKGRQTARPKAISVSERQYARDRTGQGARKKERKRGTQHITGRHVDRTVTTTGSADAQAHCTSSPRYTTTIATTATATATPCGSGSRGKWHSSSFDDANEGQRRQRQRALLPVLRQFDTPNKKLKERKDRRCGALLSESRTERNPICHFPLPHSLHSPEAKRVCRPCRNFNPGRKVETG